MSPFSPLERGIGGLVLLLLVLVPSSLGAQSASVRGRVLDRESGRPVEGATVVLGARELVAVTDAQGLFRFREVRPGRWAVHITHVAYGEHVDSVEVAPGAVIALRILVSRQAVELEPVVVEALSERELQLRSRGTRIQEITRAEIVESMRTAAHIGDVLRQRIPGVRVYDSKVLPGARTCIEFRGRRSIRFANRCQSPLVFLDGVRMDNPPLLFNTINLNSIQRIEVIPPTEAGLLYGSESAFGVILIETTVWAEDHQRMAALPRELRGRAVYDWSLEVRPHRWKRVFATAFLGNAMGLAVGLGLARNCLEFRELAYDIFATECGTWPTIVSRISAFAFPLLGTTVATRYAGATPLSRGSFAAAAAAAAMTLVPGYALTSSSLVDESRPTMWAGRLILLVGVPAAATVADNLFRRLRAAGR